MSSPTPVHGLAERIRERVRDGIGPDEHVVGDLTRSRAAALGTDGTRALHRQLRDQVLGLGPLGTLLDDDRVTDVLVNGAATVWVDRGQGLQAVAVDVGDEAAVRRLAVRLATLAGQRLDDANPCVDGLLPGGVRLHAILPPLVDGGAHLSLRIPRRAAPELATLRSWGMLTGTQQQLLAAVVESRVSFLVSGGTGTGKTTLLAAMLQLVDPAERIVVVEDVRELSVRHPHVVRLQGRGANVEGRGEVPMPVLVRQSLRMRPDRLVVGEVRGAEVRDMLGALNTGHEGGCSTVHANSAAEVVARMEALGALAGLSPGALHAQLASAVRVVVHLAKPGGRRQVREIAVLERDDGGRVQVRPADGPGGVELAAVTGGRAP